MTVPADRGEAGWSSDCRKAEGKSVQGRTVDRRGSGETVVLLLFEEARCCRESKQRMRDPPQHQINE